MSGAHKASGGAEIVRFRRRQGRATETRKKIIDAATTEFASLGFEGGTTRSIASRADVPHGLVVYHFDTKLGVWQAVVEAELSAFHTAFNERMNELEGEDDITRLRESQRLFIRLCASRPQLNWIISHEAGESSARLKWLIENWLARDIDITVNLIRKAQQQGRYVEGDPAHLHFLFLGAAGRIFTIAPEVERTMGRRPFDDAFIEQHIALVEQLFFRDPADLAHPLGDVNV